MFIYLFIYLYYVKFKNLCTSITIIRSNNAKFEVVFSIELFQVSLTALENSCDERNNVIAVLRMKTTRSRVKILVLTMIVAERKTKTKYEGRKYKIYFKPCKYPLLNDTYI
jgi:hypothetical protein